jgi:hypothetical protein
MPRGAATELRKSSRIKSNHTGCPHRVIRHFDLLQPLHLFRTNQSPLEQSPAGLRIGFFGCPKVKRQMQEFFQKHGVKSVTMSDGNMGCLHEEGQDFPHVEDCPFCPFSKGKQGGAANLF